MLIGAAACAAPAGPAATIRPLYQPYISHAAEKSAPEWDAAPVYSRALKAEIDRGLIYGRLLNEPVIDFDPIANAQDFALANLRLETDRAEPGGHAHVTAHFDNQGQASAVGYDLVREDGAWKIDAIHDGQDDLRQIIETALKPIGDPEAMKAPVRRFYEWRAQGQAAAAPFSRGFAALLKAAAAQGRHPLETAFAGAPPGQAALTFEAASGAVIVRSGSGPAVRAIVYDLVQEDGAWTIDDIRGPEAPSPWDLRTTLDKSPG
jgi:hypothetical protein